MSNAAIVGALLRELWGRPRLRREVGPTRTIGEAGILAGMLGEGRVSGRAAGGYVYQTARMSKVLVGASRCLDLGCCTGEQLLQVAMVNPTTEFIGIDRSSSILAEAAKRAQEIGINNVSWVRDDITKLNAFRHHSVDAVISSMTLNEFDDFPQLAAFMRSIRRVLKPGGAIYLEDYALLKSSVGIDFFANPQAPTINDAFTILCRTAMHSAFTVNELRTASQSFLTEVKVYTTFLIPFLAVIKTNDRVMLPTTLNLLRKLRDSLPLHQQRDCDNLHRLFAATGLTPNPFT